MCVEIDDFSERSNRWILERSRALRFDKRILKVSKSYINVASYIALLKMPNRS